MGCALVTGSSSGIGRAIAVRLAQAGHEVIVHFNRNASGAETTLSQIRAAGGKAEVLQFDVASAQSVEESLTRFFHDRPVDSPSILVNNAGIHVDNLMGMLSDEAFDSVIKTNLYGPFWIMRWCVKKMIHHRKGTIVNIASLAGQMGNPGQANYAASKAGLIAMTKSLAMEVGKRGIRVNAVSPGLIETEMLDGLPSLESLHKQIPLARIGKPEEVAAAVAFLVSDDASYITGQTLSVNGGLFPA